LAIQRSVVGAWGLILAQGPTNLEVANVPLVGGKHFLREKEFGHLVEGLAVFRGLVIFELLLNRLEGLAVFRGLVIFELFLNRLEIADGLLFCL
jgi:hypothetical protein